MEKIKKILSIILQLVAVILSIASILSLFRNSENRYLKMLDFPRIQLFILSLIVLILLIIIKRKWKLFNNLLIVGLLIGITIHSYFLINYTTLVPVEVPTAQHLKSRDNQFSLLLTNVKMSNRKAPQLIELIALKKPDLVLAMEVDSWWNDELAILTKDYPFSHQTINEVTYGMVLYSKFPLRKIEVDYLTNDKVPSFESIITFEDGKTFSFHAIHPVPPTRFQDLPDNAGQQENALKKLGKKIVDKEFPTLVAGDLNDVVWSYVDELTGTKNSLYDLRVGRGFYNSFNANNFLMRWPLDHVLVTKEFQLKKLERLSKIGSDHFPIYVELVLVDQQ
ncbi:endonuclease/exonuclease/phosphatase family protein [Gelidibacter pelagius]|uniref:Endonuclease/exonuclease/phosphatase family protein n=1 Tax=Gelidibacter pelagius TaxID=2819985 RepID=A0ABS3STJ1_9FLAO|nr:endonuclease/exonuclease/phosphatase family protein [Gelidibacter pelagius]MBO3099004.1 endonuclease/exonuclease/phosphatase family protein [Gelidibacter pelagius]